MSDRKNTHTTSLRLYDHRDVYIEIVADTKTSGIERAIDTEMQRNGIDPDLWSQVVTFLLNNGYERDELINYEDPKELVSLYKQEMNDTIDSILDDT